MEDLDNDEEKVITMEGTWDEDISIEDIHEELLDRLKEEIDELKERYRHLTTEGLTGMGQDMRILRKITSVRLKHDKLLANAKYIFNEMHLIKGRSGTNAVATPCTRLTWMKHVQDYFRYLNEMFHIDVSLNRISPRLFRSAKITGAETPGTFNKKRKMTILLQKMIEYEKINKRASTFNSRMKKYSAENLIAIPKRFLGDGYGKGFPERWLELFEEQFREYFSRSKDSVYRWYLLFSLTGTECFSNRYDFHGVCPSCSYPFVVDRVLKGSSHHTENKLSCKECMKEIDWTYFASPTEMQTMRNFLHGQVLNEIDQILRICSPARQEDSSSSSAVREPLKPLATKLLTVDHDHISETQTTVTTHTTEESPIACSSNTLEKPCRKRGRRREHDLDRLVQVAREQLLSSHREETPPPDRAYIHRGKDAASHLLTELKNFQGVSLEKIPTGVFQSVESYLMRVYKLPSREEIRREPINEKGERCLTATTTTTAPPDTVVSRRLVLEALRECGLSKWTSHVSHIMATLWWCPYPKIIHEDEEKILIFVIKQREIFERIRDKFSRKINLSVHTAMGKLLTLYGYPFEDVDFKLWETLDSKKRQDFMWEECVKEFSAGEEAPG